jgi:hypothetical protein
MKTQIKKIIIACFSFITFMSQGQTEPARIEQSRVSFTIKNPSLKSKMVDFRSYSAAKERFTAGYGYGLNGLASHAVNLPVPVYVFQEKNGKNELLSVVTEKIMVKRITSIMNTKSAVNNILKRLVRK